MAASIQAEQRPSGRTQVHHGTILDHIGSTPLVRLDKLFSQDHVTVLAKLETFNPSGSVKDRIVKHIIEDAERSGVLRSGGTIVENTSGNTGAAIAMIAAIKGYRAILTMPDKVSQEKQDALRALGAEVVRCPTSAQPGSPDHYVRRARDIAASIPGSFMIDQYDNPKNAEAHYLTTGKEIWEQTGGEIDYFVASGSTGGTISGIGRYLKERLPDLKVIMPDPVGSIYHDYFNTGTVDHGKIGTYQVEGVGEDHIAECMDFTVVDEVLQFEDADAFAMARRLARQEGIFAGGSSGANLWGCVQIARRSDEPVTIVTVLPDSGLKYLSKFFSDRWMKAQGHDISS
ncbi:PLP-dependent cysteine synthase family protein [Marichromatium purpuratum]|uniref:PLP-dependent cysteine synthase family protein n=1 Tax=Marichromatium purpuratum TaxID=37487 RepID=UPI00021E6F01|nr:cysteine synthase family protein [Marichromatium purpuratum]